MRYSIMTKFVGAACGRFATVNFASLAWVGLMTLLTACGPKELVRMRFDKVESFRIEQVGLGSAEGVATLSLYNGNKKNVIFDSGRIDILLNGRTLGIVMLQEPVVTEPGSGRTDVPVRMRFAHDGWRAVAELLSSGRQRHGRKPELRIVGSLEVSTGDSGRIKRVRFDRKVAEKTIRQLDPRLLTKFLQR